MPAQTSIARSQVSAAAVGGTGKASLVRSGSRWNATASGRNMRNSAIADSRRFAGTATSVMLSYGRSSDL